VDKYPVNYFRTTPWKTNQTKKADEVATLTPDKVHQAKRTLAFVKEGRAHALRVLSQRSYISVEQAALIRAEANKIQKKDIAPLRVALRGGTLTTSLQTTIERLGRVDF
jgi:hypothetical protein